MTNEVKSKVNTVVKRLGPNVVIATLLASAQTAETAGAEEHEVAALVMQINQSLETYGLRVLSVQIKEMGTDKLSDEEKLALTAEWRAEREAAAAYQRTVKEMQSEAVGLRLKQRAIRDGGDIGRAIMEKEAQVETAQKGRATYIVGTAGNNGSGADQALLLAKLDELTEALRGITQQQGSTGKKAGSTK
ncbi:MAG: hypothetical protein ACREU9_02250 [Gammaproteobacteria bacterium]